MQYTIYIYIKKKYPKNTALLLANLLYKIVKTLKGSEELKIKLYAILLHSGI